MFSRLNFLSFLLIIFFSINSSAYKSDIIDQEQATLQIVSAGYDLNNNLNLALEFNLKDNWKIYWKNPGDSGIAPKITSNIGTIKVFYPAPIKHIDKFEKLTLTSNIYEDKVILPLQITGLNNAVNQNIKLDITYGICSDICIAKEANFNLTIPSYYKNAKLFDDYIKPALASVPPDYSRDILINDINLYKYNNNLDLEIIAISESGFTSPQIFTYNKYINFSDKQIYISDDKKTAKFYLTYQFEHEFKEDELEILIINDDQSLSSIVDFSDIKIIENTKPQISASDSDNYLLIILIFAFIGGLILNIMPCVLPVLGIKLLSFIKNKNTPFIHVKYNFIFTILGIIASFIFIALITILLKSSGAVIGWGFHFQEPLFVIFLSIIILLFALNLWGFFEINISKYLGFADKSFKHEKLNAFFSGAFVTLLATPCTAPFLGTAVGFALTQNNITILLCFFMMGLGLSLPYILILLFPKLLNYLPKAGKWTLIVRKILALFLFFTFIWLIFILSTQLSDKSLNNNIEKLSAVEFDEAKIQKYIAEGRIIFVDITASWCLTCKFNKYITLENAETVQAFKDNHVIFMRGDWSKKDDIITNYLFKNKRAGVPFNIIYSREYPEGIILGEILDKDEIIEIISRKL